MFRKYAIYAALALLISATGAISLRQTRATETPSPEEQALHAFPSSTDVGSINKFPTALFEQELVAFEETNVTVSPGEQPVGAPTAAIDSKERLNTWIDAMLDVDQKPVFYSKPSDMALVSFDLTNDVYYSDPQSPARFRSYTSHSTSPYGLALRGGWWDIQTKGDKTKIGEYQSLQSSEFWNADGLYTDGKRTADFFISGLDSEANDAGLRYFGPRVSADIEYQRFLRRLDHDPLNGMTDFEEQTPGGDLVIKEDLNAGDDYAIRVQEFKADFKGNITDNLKWRLGLWGMRKQGERQVNAMGHCFSHPNGSDINGNPVFGVACHVLTQRQKIDWQTTEIEPGIEAKLGPATVEYTRTMRAFDQNDQVTTRSYDNFGGFFSGDLPYAVVPENFTEIDRIKANMLIGPRWDVYTHVYNGNTKNKLRDTNRRFWGYDLRTTAWSGDGISLTGYAKKNVQTGQTPGVLLPEESIGDIRSPINYDRTIAGLKGRWRPFHGVRSWRRGLSLSGGYEYRGLARENAIFTEDSVTVNQSQTTTNRMHLRTSMKWTSAFESYVRYRLGFTDDPLFGIAKNGVTNTGLPTQEHDVEIGGTWTPADNFLMTATFGIQNRSNTSEVSNFQEDDYPMIITAWYAPLPRWTFSGGLAFYSNWIDQDITLGGLSDVSTSRWNYKGRSDVINLGTTYAWSESLTVTGGFEFVRGSNIFGSPTLWPDLPGYSDVLVETTRWTAGIDYQIFNGMDFYFRYQFFDYEDKSVDINSGTASMILTGMSAIF